MKLRVTKTELLELVTRALGAKVHDIVIAKPEAKPEAKFHTNIIAQFQREGCLDHNLQIRCDKKIAAIKLLRTLYPLRRDGSYLGLACAKWAIEHWGEFVNWIINHNRFPKIDGVNYEHFRFE